MRIKSKYKKSDTFGVTDAELYETVRVVAKILHKDVLKIDEHRIIAEVISTFQNDPKRLILAIYIAGQGIGMHQLGDDIDSAGQILFSSLKKQAAEDTGTIDALLKKHETRTIN